MKSEKSWRFELCPYLQKGKTKIQQTTDQRGTTGINSGIFSLRFVFLTSGAKRMLTILLMTKKMDAITLEDKKK